MNSLQELNNYGNASITFTDNRSPTVVFDRAVPDNQSITTYQHASHAVPVGVNIIDVIRAADCTPTYTINVSASTGCTVSWPVVPSGCAVTNPSTGVYVISGVNSADIWEQVKAADIIPSLSYTGTYTYTATITYNSTSTLSWTVTNIVLPVYNFTDTVTDYYFNKSTSVSVTGQPLINDDYGTSWTVTLTPSSTSLVTSMSSAGTGGTTSFNSSTKVLTLTGTKTQVNSHLNALTVVIPSSNVQDWTLTYAAINNTTSTSQTKTQYWYSLEYLSATRANDTYSYTSTGNAITGGPLITNTSYTGSGTYTMTVAPTVTASLGTLSSTGRYGYTESQYIPDPATVAANDLFGKGVFLSKDGTYMFVGKKSNLILVYKKASGTYSLESTITITSAVSGTAWYVQDCSDDNATIAIYIGRGSATTNSDTGKIKIYTRSSTTWSLQATIAPPNLDGSSVYGSLGGAYAVKLSADGNTLLTYNCYSTSEETPQSFVYSRSGSTWTLQADLGIGLAAQSISADGNTVVTSYDNATKNVASRTPYTITNSGTTINTSTKLYGSGSVSFSGTNYYTISSFNLFPKTKLTTVEMFIRPNLISSPSSDKTILTFSNLTLKVGANGTGYVGFKLIIGSNTLTNNIQINPAAWTHICIAIAGSVARLYVNGEDAGSTIATTGLASTGTLTVGASSLGVIGFIDDLRITNDYLYDVNQLGYFSIPVVQLENIAYTQLLVQGNGTLEDNGTSSTNSLVVENAGRVKIYSRSGSTWSLQQELAHPTTPATSINFGSSAALFNSGNSLYVTDGYSKLYEYSRSGTTWSLLNTFDVNALLGTSFYLFKVNDAGTVFYGIYNKVVFRSGTAWTITDAYNGGTAGAETYDAYAAYSSTEDGLTLVRTNYNKTISGSASAGAVSVASRATGFGQSYNGTTKTLTLTGTKAQINTDIDTIKLTQADGYTTNITLTYTLTTPDSQSDSRTQLITYT